VLGEHLGSRSAQFRIAWPAQPTRSDQRLGQMSELRQVTGSADRPLAWDDRQQAQVEQLDQAGGQFARTPE